MPDGGDPTGRVRSGVTRLRLQYTPLIDHGCRCVGSWCRGPYMQAYMQTCTGELDTVAGGRGGSNEQTPGLNHRRPVLATREFFEQ